jgi:hypothetical protein
MVLVVAADAVMVLARPVPVAQREPAHTFLERSVLI